MQGKDDFQRKCTGKILSTGLCPHLVKEAGESLAGCGERTLTQGRDTKGSKGNGGERRMVRKGGKGGRQEGQGKTMLHSRKSCINSHISLVSYFGKIIMLSYGFKRYCGFVGIDANIDANMFVNLSLYGV